MLFVDNQVDISLILIYYFYYYIISINIICLLIFLHYININILHIFYLILQIYRILHIFFLCLGSQGGEIFNNISIRKKSVNDFSLI